MSKKTRIVFWILLVFFFLFGMLFIIWPSYQPPTQDVFGTTIALNLLWLFFAATLILDSRGKKKRAQKDASIKNP